MEQKDLYQQLTDRIILTGSKLIPELFRMIASEDEARLLLAMPGTPAELAEKVREPVDEVEEACRRLYTKGLAFKSFRTGEVAYKMCRDLIQFHDATILWPDASREFHDLWQQFMETEWPMFAKLAEQVFPKPFTRVIPVEEAVDKAGQQVLPYEAADKIIQNAEKIAVTPCTCRVIAKKCDHSVEVCLQIDNAARYTIDRGTGKEISKSQALEILKKCEEEGLVHVTMNRSSSGHFICNCCSCCCQALPLVITQGLKILDPSRFMAVIDQDSCTECGLCVQRCLFLAITQVAGGRMSVDPERCMGCGLCAWACPEDAISLEAVRPEDFIPD